MFIILKTFPKSCPVHELIRKPSLVAVQYGTYVQKVCQPGGRSMHYTNYIEKKSAIYRDFRTSKQPVLHESNLDVV